VHNNVCKREARIHILAQRNRWWCISDFCSGRGVSRLGPLDKSTILSHSRLIYSLSRL